MIQRIFDRILVGIIVLALWEFASLWFGFYWVSSPLRVAQRLVSWLGDGTLFTESGYTLGSAMIGFTIGAVPGAVLPFLLRQRPVIAAVLDPYLMAGYATPKLALTPLLIVWFGIGIWSKVALVASISFFLIFFNTQAGVRGISPQLIRMAEILGASEAKVAHLVVWPAALPYILAGVRVSLPFSISGTAIAEMLSANHGLGYLIQASAVSFDPTGSFTAIITLTAILTIVNIAVNRTERRLFGWRPTAAAFGRPKGAQG